jgi:hypothetical protein
MKQNSKVLTMTLACLAIFLMFSAMSPLVWAETYVIDESDVGGYDDWGYYAGGDNYSHIAYPAYGYTKVNCDHNSYICVYMEAQASYSGGTVSTTIHIKVHVTGMSYDEDDPWYSTAITRMHVSLVDLTTATTVYENTNVAWRPQVASTADFEYSFAGTITNGHTYVLHAGPYAQTTNGWFGYYGEAEAIGTITEMQVYY